MKDPVDNKEIVYEDQLSKTRSPIRQKIADICFAIFIAIFFTFPLWCIMVVAMHFVTKL